jgi:ABC-type multidrug transport system ATPase subunit
MGADGGVYVLDEPTTGLHLADLEQLLGLLDRLVDTGKSVIVIEHHPTVMAHADWIIDLGPGAGHDGGRIVFEGTPSDLVAARSTLTGEHLASFVGSRPNAVSSRSREPVARGRAAAVHVEGDDGARAERDEDGDRRGARRRRRSASRVHE